MLIRYPADSVVDMNQVQAKLVNTNVNSTHSLQPNSNRVNNNNNDGNSGGGHSAHNATTGTEGGSPGTKTSGTDDTKVVIGLI